MTIRMLIVDDEPIICQGLRETIAWDTIDVEVAGKPMTAWRLYNSQPRSRLIWY